MSKQLEKYYNELMAHCPELMSRSTNAMTLNKLMLRPEFQEGYDFNKSKKHNDNEKQDRREIISHQPEGSKKVALKPKTSQNQICIRGSAESIELPKYFQIYSNSDEIFIECVSRNGPSEDVIIEKFNLRITRYDLGTLVGLNWLNDEVINFYMLLLNERSKQMLGYPTVYSMNTFFIPRLTQSGFTGVQRWTRKVDIFAYDIIPVPVLVNEVHWCMAIIHFKNKTIKYYDSMGKRNHTVLLALVNFLKEESMEKRKTKFSMDDWEIGKVRGLPRQKNDNDCGVFSCMFAEYVTRNKPVTFSQEDMVYFRQKMIYEIAMGKLVMPMRPLTGIK